MQGLCDLFKSGWRGYLLAMTLLPWWLPTGLGPVMDLLPGWWLNFECPVLWAAANVPLALTLWFLLSLLSLWFPWSGCAGSAGLDGVIIYQLDCGLSSSIFASMKVAKGSMTWHSSHAVSANWQGLLGCGSWAFSAQYCRALAYAKVFCSCHMQYSCLPNVMLEISRNQSCFRA